MIGLPFHTWMKQMAAPIRMNALNSLCMAASNNSSQPGWNAFSLVQNSSSSSSQHDSGRDAPVNFTQSSELMRPQQ